MKDKYGNNLNAVNLGYRDVNVLYRGDSTISNDDDIDSTIGTRWDICSLDIYFNNILEVDVLIQLLQDFRKKMNEEDWKVEVK